MSNRNFDSRVIIQRLKDKNQAQSVYRAQTTGQPTLHNPQNSDASPQVIQNYKVGSETTYSQGLLGGYTVDTGAVANILAANAIPNPPPVTVPSAPSISRPRGSNPSNQLLLYVRQDSDGGSPITNYQYSLDNGATFQAFSPPQTVTNLPLPSSFNAFTISGLMPSTTYYVIFKAVNAAGVSDASNMLVDPTSAA